MTIDEDTGSVPSPCIQVCSLDQYDVCVGCYREMQEIVDWQQLSDADRRLVLARAAERRRARGQVL